MATAMVMVMAMVIAAMTIQNRKKGMIIQSRKKKGGPFYLPYPKIIRAYLPIPYNG